VKRSVQINLRSFFTRKITIFKWQFNLFAFVCISIGVVLGLYAGAVNIFKSYAVNDTFQTWTFNIANANNYTYDSEFIAVNNSGAHLGVNKLTNGSLDTDLAGWSDAQSYIIKDEFTDTRAGGSVNGTSATPTGGLRSVTDTNSKLSIGGGSLIFTTGGVAAGDPGLRYSSMSRTPGRIIYGKITLDNVGNSGYTTFGFDDNTVTRIEDGALFYDGRVYHFGAGANVGEDVSKGVEYDTAVIQRSSGSYLFLKGGIYTSWTLISISNTGSFATTYPGFGVYTSTISALAAGLIRVPTTTWIPTPLAYDTFTRSDGSAGSTEAAGPDSQTTERLSWSTGTISSNGMKITPSVGMENWTSATNLTSWTEYLAGTSTLNQESSITHSGSYSSRSDIDASGSYAQAVQSLSGSIGDWVASSVWGRASASGKTFYSMSTGSRILTEAGSENPGTTWTRYYNSWRVLSSGDLSIWPVYRSSASSSSLYRDDISVKKLSLPSLFSVLSTSDSDVLAEVNVTMEPGNPAGLVLNLDSTSNPQNFVIAYHDGGNVKLEKSVGGVYTSVQSTAVTYVAGAPLKVTKTGTKYKIYYNNALVGSEQTISDAGIISNTNHGVFSTYSENTFDNFALWARGSGGEYNDIPAEDLTATYETTTKYSGAGSAKLITSGNNANFLQSINTGDTNVYSLVTYAYTDGSAVTSSDLVLYHDGSVVPTQFTSVGGGWYRLTGTITGAASSKDVGIRVKAGKTVYVDEFLLYKLGEVTLTNSKFESDVSGWSGTQSYLLQDEFTDTRAAGSVNGTSATPTGGVRTVADTSSQLSIGGGRVQIGDAPASYTNISYPQITRQSGRALIGNLKNNFSYSAPMFGFDDTVGGQIADGVRFASGGGFSIYDGALTAGVGTYVAGTDYTLAVIQRAAGNYYFIKGGAYSNWSLLYMTNNSTGNRYPSLSAQTPITSVSSDYIRVPSLSWLPTPLAYDTFTRADGVIGNSETTGPDSQTTPSLVWTGGTISGNKITITPEIGSELVTNGNMEIGDPPSSWSSTSTFDGVADERTGGSGAQSVDITGVSGGVFQDLLSTNGTWVSISNWQKNITGGFPKVFVYGGPGYTNPIYDKYGSSDGSWHNYIGSGRVTSTAPRVYLYLTTTGHEYRYDDISVKPLTLSSLFSTVSTSDSDVMADANVTLTSGTQAGLVLNLDSTSNPQNFVIAYHDGTNVKLEKSVAGVYTTVQTTAVTYSAGAQLRVIKDGTKYRVYYNNTLVGAELTISDAGIISNTKHGLFSTYSGNTFDNFSLFARGTGGEYTDIPAEDVTATYSTVHKYTGNGSALLSTGGNDSNFVQSINVGDTSQYSLVAYAYTDGSAVTANDLELYYNDSVLSTTFTDMGGGWYKLSGVFTGIASSKDLGVRVKASKTVYVDDISLYQQSAYSIFNTDGYYNQLVTSWDSFSSDVTTPGSSSIKYQVCTNDGDVCESGVGANWKYWNGSVWSAASNLTTHTNTAAQLTQSVMQELDTLTQKISVKVILNPDGINFPNIANMIVGMTTDTTDPVNATLSRFMKTPTLSCDYTDNCWTGVSTPIFEWEGGDDNESGLKGYCLYFGTDEAGDPAHNKGKLGTSPVPVSGTSCQFIISGEQLDLSTAGYLGTALSNDDTFITSANTYYLNIKSVDNAGNVVNVSETIRFRYDETAPTNVSYISTPSGNFSNVVDMSFSWPVSGAGISHDDESDVLGWQYQINSMSGEWQGTQHSDLYDIDYIPLGESSYTLAEVRDGSFIVSGDNIIYFRTVDNVGNFSGTSTIRTGNISYGGEAPDFAPTDIVTVTPTTSETNSYALSWPAATPSVGTEVAHYYYMINTPPPSTLNTLQSNTAAYLDNGTSLTVSARAMSNVNKGSNTVYVVAVDDADVPNYSPSNYITGTFTLDSTNPDNVGNLVVSDSSIKSQSQWNVTLTWTAPEYQGAGNLSYLVYRSEDGISFIQVGSSSGFSYVDSAPESRQYFYKIVTKDGADALSSGTNTVTIIPTGKWTAPADLESAPFVSSITTKKAQITWSTSRASDSKIAFGTKSGLYFEEEPSNSDQVTSHSINLSGLNPNTTYFYVAKWTDEDGNTGISEEKSFKTQAAPVIKNVLAKNIGLSSAIIQFTSKGSSKVKIYYGESSNFGGVKEVPTSPIETTYTVELTGLKDGTKYFYKLNAFDVETSEYDGTILDFITLPKPRISEIVLQEVSGTSQTTILVTWQTNTEVSSIITYYPEGRIDQARDEVIVTLKKGEHKMIIRGLLPQTSYYLVVKGRDRIGNEAVSDSYKFATSTDSRAPQISGMLVEGSTIPAVSSTAEETKAQLIVSWNTDEPATSQIEYGEGTGTSYPQKTQLDNNLTLNHIVIISGLSPSKVYHLRVLSKDKAGNEGKSIDTVTITPKSTDNALNLVITNLQEIFGVLGR